MNWLICGNFNFLNTLLRKRIESRIVVLDKPAEVKDLVISINRCRQSFYVLDWGVFFHKFWKNIEKRRSIQGNISKGMYVIVQYRE
ncbi:uncharacterized protein VTP21DRAFT_2635 [Calcarisporiella thermophila]|uniref:uncharacterized protein n=1 Tax=Calcarisporiella thermophila TaxID=911321 RepID=UPI00374493D3